MAGGTLRPPYLRRSSRIRGLIPEPSEPPEPPEPPKFQARNLAWSPMPSNQVPWLLPWVYLRVWGVTDVTGFRTGGSLKSWVAPCKPRPYLEHFSFPRTPSSICRPPRHHGNTGHLHDRREIHRRPPDGFAGQSWRGASAEHRRRVHLPLDTAGEMHWGGSVVCCNT